MYVNVEKVVRLEDVIHSFQWFPLVCHRKHHITSTHETPWGVGPPGSKELKQSGRLLNTVVPLPTLSPEVMMHMSPVFSIAP